MVITEHVIAEFRFFKLFLCRIQANLGTMRLEFLGLVELGGYRQAQAF